MKLGQTTEYKNKLGTAIELYKNGKTTREISNLIGMDNSVLRENLRENGFKVKDSNYNETINRNAFSSIKTEEQAYWLGFLYADGYVAKDSNRIELTIKDKEHVEKFAEFLFLNKSVVKEKIGRIKERNFSGLYYRLSIRNVQIHSDLIAKGCTPKKSLTLVFPKEDILPKELQNHFVRGYFDGDGSLGIYSNKGAKPTPQLSIIGTKEFLDSIKKIYDLPENKYTRCGKAFQYATVSKSQVEKFLISIYKNSVVYLDRKYNLFIDCRFE